MATSTSQPYSTRITLANDLGTTSSHRITVLCLEVDISDPFVSDAQPLYAKWNKVSAWARESGIKVNAVIHRAHRVETFSDKMVLILEFGNTLDLANYKLSFGNS